MHPLLPLAYTALVLVQSPTSDNGLKGFRQFTFGMGIKEAIKLDEFDSPSDLDHGYLKYPLLKKYRIVGVDFGVALYFKDGALSFATLNDDSPVTIKLCQRRFSAIMAKIVDAYGSGNGHPSIDINGSPDEADYFETHRFDSRYPNGTNVQVSTTYNGETCRVSIALQGAPNQLGF